MKRYRLLTSNALHILQSKREGIGVVLDALNIHCSFGRVRYHGTHFSQRMTFYPVTRKESVIAVRAMKSFY